MAAACGLDFKVYRPQLEYIERRGTGICGVRTEDDDRVGQRSRTAERL